MSNYVRDISRRINETSPGLDQHAEALARAALGAAQSGGAQ